jgi:hypothetical protein
VVTVAVVVNGGAVNNKRTGWLVLHSYYVQSRHHTDPKAVVGVLFHGRPTKPEALGAVEASDERTRFVASSDWRSRRSAKPPPGSRHRWASTVAAARLR